MAGRRGAAGRYILLCVASLLAASTGGGDVSKKRDVSAHGNGPGTCALGEHEILSVDTAPIDLKKLPTRFASRNTGAVVCPVVASTCSSRGANQATLQTLCFQGQTNWSKSKFQIRVSNTSVSRSNHSKTSGSQIRKFWFEI